MKDDRELETRRPRGRPRVDEPMALVSTRLPVRDYDRLIRLAQKQEMSVADLLRRRILREPR